MNELGLVLAIVLMVYQHGMIKSYDRDRLLWYTTLHLIHTKVVKLVVDKDGDIDIVSIKKENANGDR